MSEYHTFGIPMLFAQWRIDLLGPFLKETSGKNHLVAAIDHVTRWNEVKGLATIIARKVNNEFFYEDVTCRFGIPKL